MRHVIWYHTEEMPIYLIHKYFVMLNTFDCRGIVMEINQIGFGELLMVTQDIYIFKQECIVETSCFENPFLLS